jgi:hypothetical protein
MTCNARAAALLLALTCACAAPLAAQEPPRPQFFVDVSDESYRRPTDPKYQPIYERLRQRQVLEELRDFLKPLRLPRRLKVTVAECGAETLPYTRGGPVTICYELIERIRQMARTISADDAADQEKLVVAGFIQATLHNTALAIFDMLDVPIWGREEDAADRLAALVMVEFGEDVAKAVLSNTTRLFEASAKLGEPWTGSDFAKTASPDAQRYFNYLCIALGADVRTFGELWGKVIPRHRAGFCAGWLFEDDVQITLPPKEYEQIKKAFDLRIMPYVDPDALVEVRATPWLSWTPKK